ncbi:MAG: hypothetical protein V1865_02110 [bacterium]
MDYSTSSSRNQITKQIKYLIIALLITLTFHTPVAQANEIGRGFYQPISDDEKIEVFLARQDNESFLKNVVKKERYIVKSESVRGITAYNVGDIYQCAGDPCISANGENICEALARGYRRCAANFVKFGTILEIEGYGQCMVTDRMNSRYPDRVDIAFKYEEQQEAHNWGYKRLNVKILKKVVEEVEVTSAS